MSRKKGNKNLKRRAKGRQAQSVADATRHQTKNPLPGVSVRRATAGESYSTSLNRTKMEDAFRQLSDEMQANRSAWQSGPPVDLDAWQALPEIPLEDRRHPSRAYYVVDLLHFACPLSEALARKIVDAQDVDGADDLPNPDAGAISLGSIVVEAEDHSRQRYRLPPSLGKWVAGQIGITRRGYGQFPAYVGFCRPRPGVPLVEFMPLPSADADRQRRYCQKVWIGRA